MLLVYQLELPLLPICLKTIICNIFVLENTVHSILQSLSLRLLHFIGDWPQSLLYVASVFLETLHLITGFHLSVQISILNFVSNFIILLKNSIILVSVNVFYLTVSNVQIKGPQSIMYTDEFRFVFFSSSIYEAIFSRVRHFYFTESYCDTSILYFHLGWFEP